MENLNDYYKNVNSQRGEDGIIEEICKRLGLKQGVCVEFGAGDGISLSNTRNLVLKGWGGLFIESDAHSYNRCAELYKGNPRVTCLNKAVSNGENSYDNLMDHFFPYIPDIVSIDIDGNDYEIFKGIKNFLPSLFIIECNPYRYPLDSQHHGLIHDLQESFYLFNEVAGEKGYRPICYTQNIFFIKEEYHQLFNVTSDLMTLFINGFVRSFYRESDKGEVGRILARINGFNLDNSWLKKIVQEYCNG